MLVLCPLIAVAEGADLQSIGVAAPKMLPEFGISAAQAGFLFSASVIGLFFGALIGGALSDRIGRKWLLVGSVSAFGLFSLLTVVMPNLNMLTLMRFLTGLGLGGAMPNLIALVSENSPPRWRRTLTTAVWAGTPVGGVIVSQLGATPNLNWRAIFIVGGLAPLLIVPATALFLSESVAFRAGLAAGPGRAVRWSTALFAEGRARRTALMWLGQFFTLLLLYLLLNWLPVLLATRGFSKPDAAISSAYYNIGGVTGGLLLAIALRLAPRAVVIPFVYGGMALGLAGLALARADLGITFAYTTMLGFFVIGGQYVLYGVTPDIYPIQSRGAGVGSAVAVGRLGGVAGPILAGQMLSLHYPVQSLLLALAPLPILACAAVLLALAKLPASE